MTRSTLLPMSGRLNLQNTWVKTWVENLSSKKPQVNQSLGVTFWRRRRPHTYSSRKFEKVQKSIPSP